MAIFVITAWILPPNWGQWTWHHPTLSVQ